MSQESKLTLAQKEAVFLLARGYSIRRVSDELGLNEHRVRRWRTYPRIQGALREQIAAPRSRPGPMEWVLDSLSRDSEAPYVAWTEGVTGREPR